MRRADGGWVWVESRLQAVRDADGRLTGVQTSSRDISDRKAAEAARAIADEQFRTAFDDAPIGMALVGIDGTWLRINDALCAMRRLHAARSCGERTFQDVTHPDDVEADVALVREVLVGRPPRLPDGEALHPHATAARCGRRCRSRSCATPTGSRCTSSRTSRTSPSASTSRPKLTGAWPTTTT